MFRIDKTAGLVLEEIADGETLDTLKQATGAPFEVADLLPMRKIHKIKFDLSTTFLKLIL